VRTLRATGRPHPTRSNPMPKSNARSLSGSGASRCVMDSSAWSARVRRPPTMGNASGVPAWTNAGSVRIIRGRPGTYRRRRGRRHRGPAWGGTPRSGSREMVVWPIPGTVATKPRAARRVSPYLLFSPGYSSGFRADEPKSSPSGALRPRNPQSTLTRSTRTPVVVKCRQRAKDGRRPPVGPSDRKAGE